MVSAHNALFKSLVLLAEDLQFNRIREIVEDERNLKYRGVLDGGVREDFEPHRTIHKVLPKAKLTAGTYILFERKHREPVNDVPFLNVSELDDFEWKKHGGEQAGEGEGLYRSGVGPAREYENVLKAPYGKLYFRLECEAEQIWSQLGFRVLVLTVASKFSRAGSIFQDMLRLLADNQSDTDEGTTENVDENGQCNSDDTTSTTPPLRPAKKGRTDD